jgi:hypothetical protein
MTLSVTNIAPPPGSVIDSDWQTARKTPIAFDLEVDAGQLPVVRAKYGESPHAWPVIYDGSKFSPLFLENSTIDSVGDVHTFSLLPLGGWWRGFSIVPSQGEPVNVGSVLGKASARANAYSYSPVEVTLGKASATANAYDPDMEVLTLVTLEQALGDSASGIGVDLGINPAAMVADDLILIFAMCSEYSGGGGISSIVGDDTYYQLSEGVEDPLDVWLQLWAARSGSGLHANVDIDFDIGSSEERAAAMLIYRGVRRLLGSDVRRFLWANSSGTSHTTEQFTDDKGIVAAAFAASSTTTSTPGTRPAGWTEQEFQNRFGLDPFFLSALDRTMDARGETEDVAFPASENHRWNALTIELRDGADDLMDIDGTHDGNPILGAYMPATSGDWTAIGEDPPDSMYLCQDASGNPVDTIGALALTASGTPGYALTRTGWDRDALSTLGAADLYENTGGAYDLGFGDDIAALWVGELHATGPDGIFHLHPGASEFRIEINSSELLEVSHNGSTYTSAETYANYEGPILLRRYNGANQVWTLKEVFTFGSSVSSLTGSGFGLGDDGTGYTTGVYHFHFDIWYNANAANIGRATLEALGWRLSY